MKASEFVAQIQALIAEHGDLELLEWEPGDGKWSQPVSPTLDLIYEDGEISHFGIISF